MHRRDRTKFRKRGTVFKWYFWSKHKNSKGWLNSFQSWNNIFNWKSQYTNLFWSVFYYIEIESFSNEQNFNKSNYGDKLAGFCRISRSIGSGTLGCKFWQILFPTRTGRKWSTRVIPDSRKTGLSGFKCKIC